MTKQLVLLGDSVFDNGAYVEPGQDDVTAHLERKLDPLGWTLEMRAIDGDVASGVEWQLKGEPLSLPCIFVLSAGGNDALPYMELIGDTETSRSMASVMFQFNEIRERFRADYVKAIDLILSHEQPLIVCTIYNPVFPEKSIQLLAETGLSFFNDVITEEALRRGLPIIDLREVCSLPEAFANPIEPSEIGGDLITNAIIEAIDELQSEERLEGAGVH